MAGDHSGAEDGDTRWGMEEATASTARGRRSANSWAGLRLGAITRSDGEVLEALGVIYRGGLGRVARQSSSAEAAPAISGSRTRLIHTKRKQSE
jgi:hypothetical protein